MYLFLAVVFLSLRVTVYADLVEMDGSGNIIDSFDDVGELPEEMSEEFFNVEISNDFNDNTLSLMWKSENDDDEDVKITEILPKEKASIKTLDGHVFYAELVDDGSYEDLDDITEITPRKIMITRAKKAYRFGPATPAKPASHEMSTAKAGGMHPAVKIIGRRTTAMSAKFKCLLPKVDYYYEDGNGGSFQGTLTMGRETTTNTYEGHIFFFTEAGDKSKEIARFKMVKEQFLYVVQDPKRPPPKDLAELAAKEQAFMKEYEKKNGILWRHYYGPDGPRPPPTLFMWPAEEIGQIHKVTSHEGKWNCTGPAEKCQSKEPVHLELQVVSLKPKVFIINNFLSAFEADDIIKHAQDKLKESTVGNKDGGGQRKSETRTSLNAWVGRHTSDPIETLYRRAADLLQLDEKLLNSQNNAEEMQVVHYVNGQKYDSHHDWGVSGYPESRYITMLMYLTDMAHPNAGGETAFPKGADGKGFKVHPGRGSAVLFYNLLEDGNGDDLALHAALPVIDGEKYLANWWVWDPKRR